MGKLRDELKNRVIKKCGNEQTLLALIQELEAMDDEIGSSIVNCLKSKDIALKGNKDDIKCYVDYITKRLADSVQMTVLFRTLLGKVLTGVVTIDRELVKHGGIPVSPILLEGRVEFK